MSAAASITVRLRTASRFRRPRSTGAVVVNRPNDRTSREPSAGAAAPDWIALTTPSRVRRRVDAHVPATSTSSIGQAATSMCQGFAATVGAPSIVCADDPARWGATSAPRANPRTTPTTPSAADSIAKTLPT
jgi:hypothetical protein